MITRKFTVLVNGDLVQLEDMEELVPNIVLGQSFRELLKSFGLLKSGLHLQVANKSYYVKDDVLYNYVELTNEDTGIKYYGSVKMCTLEEGKAHYTFFYGEGTN